MLRSHGVIPIAGDLDDAASLHGLAGIAHEVLHCAPPPNRGTRDTRTAHLIAALAKGKSLPQQLAYISTSGVYGDCGGELVDETHQVRPRTERARPNCNKPDTFLGVPARFFRGIKLSRRIRRSPLTA